MRIFRFKKGKTMQTSEKTTSFMWNMCCEDDREQKADREGSCGSQCMGGMKEGSGAPHAATLLSRSSEIRKSPRVGL